MSDILRRFHEVLVESYGAHLLGLDLIASYARGEESAGSDVDVLVVLDQVESAGVEIRRPSKLSTSLSLDYEMTVSARWVFEPDWVGGETSSWRASGTSAISRGRSQREGPTIPSRFRGHSL